MSTIRKRDQMRLFFGSMFDMFRRSGASERSADISNKNTTALQVQLAGADLVIFRRDRLFLWDSWDLDPAFFEALSRWALDNSDNTLDRFLERTVAWIDRGDNFLEMVPDGIIPIRGFCKALAYLLKLGATIGRAQREVYEFARYVIHWVNSIKSAFQSKGLGSSTLRLQKVYLGEMRTLINEICTWAAARLEDGRWSIQGLTAEKEIDDFKARIAEARALFMDVTLIMISKSHDTSLKAIQSLVSTIQEIKLSQTSVLEFLKEQEKEATRRRFLGKMLSPHLAEKTAYDEQGKRPCDDDTRVEILQDIKSWVYDTSENAQRFLWLTGDPGCGKSAITASIARECKNKDVLWAQFFINRNLAGTTDPASYFPSIARQLADRSSAVALAIFDALKAQPDLVDDISQDQAGTLFVDSLRVASSSDPTKPVVVIIDGLDETVTARLESTAAIFAKAVLDLPGNVKVFISSRTETEIRKPFSSTFAGRPRVVKHIHLDTSSPSSIQDVSRFLGKGILQIAQQNNLDVLEWPGEQRLGILYKRAAGLFIWAVTVIGFIKEEVRASGKEILNTILDDLTADDLDDINTLYSTILSIVFYRRKDPWEFERFRRIVGCIVSLREPLCIADIASLLDLRNPKSNEPVDVLHFIGRLRTILVAGADEITHKTVPRLHKSFFEFITSKPIMRECHALPLYVNVKTADGEIALRCFSFIINCHIPNASVPPISHLDLISGPSGGPDRQGWQSDVLLRYAHRYVSSHLSLVPWGTRAGILVARTSSLRELEKCLGQQTPRATIARPVSGNNSDNALCVCSSPNGRYIASGTKDGKIVLRDVVRGRETRPFLKGHTPEALSVAFSPDGSLLVSGSADNTVCLWNVETGEQIGSPLTYHTGSVNSVAFSPDGKRVVSGAKDHDVHVWDLDSKVALRLREHTDAVQIVAFSPPWPREYILSGSEDTTIRLWECSGKGVNYLQKYEGHTGPVFSAGFVPITSPNAKMQFISGSADKSIRLWDIELGTCTRVFEGHYGWVTSVTCPPGSEFAFSGSVDGTIRIWELETGRCVGRAMNTTQISSVISHECLIISSGVTTGIQVWAQEKTSPDTVVLSPLYSFNSAIPIALSISPDHGNIGTAFSNNNVLVWVASTNTYVPLRPPSGNMTGENSITLAFSPDGGTLAIVYPNHDVYLWRVETKQLLSSFTLPEHISSPASISLSSTGEHLLTIGTDGRHRVWDASNGVSVPTSIGSFKLEGVGETVLSGRTTFTWYPLSDPVFGFWATIDGRLIRKDNNGVITVTLRLPWEPQHDYALTTDKTSARI